MYNKNEISLTEATVLALQGKLKLEETKPVKRTKRIKSESVNINTDEVNVSVDDNGNTIVDTDNKTITVSDKVTENPPIEEPIEDKETIDVPIEGDETILPEEEVSEEEISVEDEEPIEDLEKIESKKLNENNSENNEELDESKETCDNKWGKQRKIESASKKDFTEDDYKKFCQFWVEANLDGYVEFEGEGVENPPIRYYPEARKNDSSIYKSFKDMFDSLEIGEAILMDYEDGQEKELAKYGITQEDINLLNTLLEESKAIGKSDKVYSSGKCEDCKKEICECGVKTETKFLEKESKLTDYIDEEDLDKIINNNSYLSKIGCKNYEAISDMKLSVSTKGYTDFDRTFKVVKNDDGVWEAYEIDNSGKKIGETFILNETKHTKTESKISFNKKSFEEALTKFYKFNSKKVESFNLDKVLINKKGDLKIEGKLNNKVPVTMIFNKKTEGKSFIKYTLASTNNILKESKEITTNLMTTKNKKILECRYILSK